MTLARIHSTFSHSASWWFWPCPKSEKKSFISPNSVFIPFYEVNTASKWYHKWPEVFASQTCVSVNIATWAEISCVLVTVNGTSETEKVHAGHLRPRNVALWLRTSLSVPQTTFPGKNAIRMWMFQSKMLISLVKHKFQVKKFMSSKKIRNLTWGPQNSFRSLL